MIVVQACFFSNETRYDIEIGFFFHVHDYYMQNVHARLTIKQAESARKIFLRISLFNKRLTLDANSLQKPVSNSPGLFVSLEERVFSFRYLICFTQLL